MLIEGIFAAVPTPFYPDEKIYYRKLEANMARYSRTLLPEWSSSALRTRP